MKTRILVIDDNTALCSNIYELLTAEGFDAIPAHDGEEGVTLATAHRPDLVVCDILMPGLDGYGVLASLRQQAATANIPFIFLSAKADRSDVRTGMNLGADDYVTKPFELPELLNAVRARLRRAHDSKQRAGAAVERAAATAGLPHPGFAIAAGVVLVDARMQEIYGELERAAQSSISVLLLGETGVGKDVLARTLHDLSPRHDKPFVAFNCAALSESLLQSELFGHEKGAFTGAHQSRPGLFERAEGGTLFLDEVGDLPPSVQSALLRVLEDRMLTRLGGRSARKIDVRFVSATRWDLAAAIKEGKFRSDLFYRINGFALQVPPLRERRSEIPALCRVFLAHAAAERGSTQPFELEAEALERLLAYEWPGNIRELRNEIEAAALRAGAGTIQLRHLSATLRQPPPPNPPTSGPPSSGQQLKELHADQRRQAVLAALERNGGNQTKAAVELGVARRTLVYWMTEFGLTTPRTK